MSYLFSKIVIIYNPNSTGDSQSNAENLAKTLKRELPNVVITLLGTEFAGHGEEIGAEYAKKDENVLLVSSSGDGGYNELINGILSGKPPKNLSVCVLPSGNANDHYHAVNGENVAEKIIAGKTAFIDVIEMSAQKDGKPWKRYAHSYVGFGLTAYIGKKLTEATLNPINEKWLVAKYLLSFRSVSLKLSGHKNAHRYSNVIIGNIARMSKIIKLDQTSAPNDGMLELYMTRTSSLPKLLLTLFFASTIGLKPRRKFQTLSIEPRNEIEVQLDGEVISISGDKITLKAKTNQLRSV